MVESQSQLLRESPLSYFWKKKFSVQWTSFSGWRMPLHFGSIVEETLHTRREGTFFDTSHMGKICIRGEGSLDFIDSLSTNDIRSLPVGRARYTLLLNEKGGVLDDIYVYRLKEKEVFVCVNAVNHEKVWSHLVEEKSKYTPSIELMDDTFRWAMLAVQGPRCFAVLAKFLSANFGLIPGYKKNNVVLLEGSILLTFTGYSGEEGVEFFFPQEKKKFFEQFVEFLNTEGLRPAGLGARDILRLEMGYPLYGQEFSGGDLPPRGLVDWAIKLENREFKGKKALEANGSRKVVKGFRLLEPGVARAGYAIVDRRGYIQGQVSSGGWSPHLEASIGLALLDTKALSHEEVEGASQAFVEIRNRKVALQFISFPFLGKEVTKKKI